MSRSRGVTLKGAACGAFIEAISGHVAMTDDDRALRIATIIHMEMKSGDSRTAVALVKAVAREGLESAAGYCTAKRAAPTKVGA